MKTNAVLHNPDLAIATYNVQFSLHSEVIVHNLDKLKNLGASIICLQEIIDYHNHHFIIDSAIKHLGLHWQAIYHLGQEPTALGMGTAILYNTQTLHLLSHRKILLPPAPPFTAHEQAFSWLAGGVKTPVPRRSLTTIFHFNHHLIRVTNLHLDPTGGTNHRRQQLQSVVHGLNQNPLNHEIICGDLNSFDLLKTGRETRMHHQIFGPDYLNVSQTVNWTADLHNIDTTHASPIFKFLLTTGHLHLKRKLDHIYTKGFFTTDCHRLPYDGSDHQPLLAHLFTSVSP